MQRCTWCGVDSLYTAYHDQEWGVPIYDELRLFEFLILETMQAGLSWLTILRKRENFRQAFDNFNPEKIANYNANKFNELLNNTAIIRNRLKIQAAITNAKAFLLIQERGSFSDYLWQFTGGQVIQNQWENMSDVPASTSISDKMSKDLKQRGFSFVGSTICYAHMQATGMVNDHLTHCFRHRELMIC
jgi:DNA-3-methyladenine glycosylase I